MSDTREPITIAFSLPLGIEGDPYLAIEWLVTAAIRTDGGGPSRVSLQERIDILSAVLRRLETLQTLTSAQAPGPGPGAERRGQ